MSRLIGKYLPADYCDCFKREFNGDVETLFSLMFEDFPAPVRWLFRLRNFLVKPLRLKCGGTFKDKIIEKNEEEIILGMDDKHLAFWVSLYCPRTGNAEVCTVVKFHNALGRVYFIGIWMFHKLLVGSLFRRASEILRGS